GRKPVFIFLQAVVGIESGCDLFMISTGNKTAQRKSLLQLLGRALDRLTNAHIGSAAAKIPAHRFLYIRVSRFGRLFQQCDRYRTKASLYLSASRRWNRVWLRSFHDIYW